MNNKLKRFYRISIWLIAILISINVLVKAVIWFCSSSIPVYEPEIHYRITAFQGIPQVKDKYTTERRQKLFNAVNHLLTPAFALFFVLIAVKLVKTPDIFKEDR
ncbi:MAG: hypothetical protein ISS43_04605 [Candidatus Omnitrophica bacterium]|nr:hypothetical protein [Candidatus Omnitrophota bacterium]